MTGYTNKHTTNKQGISRRKFLTLGLFTAVSGVIPYRALASLENFLLHERILSFYNLHTKEYVKTVYWRDGTYREEALAEINHIFRDHYSGAVKPIDTKLLDLLCALQQKLKSAEPFSLISGYRTVKTNAFLRRQRKGAAQKSLHIDGKAADIRLPGYDLDQLRSAAYELKAGGVGYYTKKNFVHLDVGEVRYWGR